jgi:caspase domain-containing protein
MRRWPFFALLPFLLAGMISTHAFADKRIALVVGNSDYRNVAVLDNPANDAKLLANTLSSLGFTLVGGGAQLDLDKASLDRVVQAFGAQLSGADVGLFYYAGHGVQVRGENYLIPVDANPTKEVDVDFQMLDANLVLRQMEGAGTRLNIVILDACRNNPFGGRSLAVGRARDAENDRMRATGGGLAQMQAPEGTLISFATQPGSVAQDGANGNSPYARALADTIRKPGLGIFDAFNQIGLQVKRATGGAQQPWVSSSPIDGSFYFVAPASAGAPAVALAAPDPRTTAPPGSQPTADEIAWLDAVAAGTITSFNNYLTAFPAGNHAAQAHDRVADLGAPTAQPSRTRSVGPFDGTWVTQVDCPKAGPAGAFSILVDADVKDGVYHAEKGKKGTAGWFSLDGRVESDGAVELVARGIVNSSFLAAGNVPVGSEYGYRVAGRLVGSKGVGERVGGRSCKVTFSK